MTITSDQKQKLAQAVIEGMSEFPPGRWELEEI